MLELQAVSTGLFGCYARPAVLDQLERSTELALRTAPDELLVLGVARQFSDVEAELVAQDHNGLAVELTSGFRFWALRGDDRREAFGRLSQLKLPDAPALVQGLVAHVPAKVIVREDELVLIVSSAIAHHLHERVLTACADLTVREQILPTLEEAVRA